MNSAAEIADNDGDKAVGSDRPLDSQRSARIAGKRKGDISLRPLELQFVVSGG